MFRGCEGQAAIEAIAGAVALILLAAVAWNVVGLLAAAGELQARTREAAVREAGGSSGAREVVRSIVVNETLPVGTTRLTARAAVRDPAE